MKRSSLHLYGVTDSRLVRPGHTLSGDVEQAIRGGMTMVQLREKELDKKAIIAAGKTLKTVTKKYGVPLIINDYPDVAKAVGADGVHIGQSDVEMEKAREILPEGIIGVSVQTVEQAKRAQENGADYLGVGAMFPTGTKTDAKVIKMETLEAICEAVSIPIVVIGGISEQTMRLFRNTKIDGIAVVSALFGAEDIKEAAKRLQAWR